jgi:hypothetical protein
VAGRNLKPNQDFSTMMISKKNPAVHDPNVAFFLTQQIRDAAAALTAALDARIRIDTVIARNVTERQAAGEARATAEAQAGRLETELALELDDEKIRALEAGAEAAGAALQEAVIAFARTERLRGTLYARASQADAEIAAARQAFQFELGIYAATADDALAAEAREAAQKLVVVLRRGHAVAAALASLGQPNGFLDDVMIRSPAHLQLPIIDGNLAELPDGSHSNLAADWRTDPGASELAEIMKPLGDLRRRVARHSAFVPPPLQDKPYLPREENRLAIDYNKGIEEREAAAPKPKPWLARSWTIERGGKASPAAAGGEINAVHGIADAAMLPDRA